MKRSKEEILKLTHSILGERSDDEVVTFLEDLTDTLDGVGGVSQEEYDAVKAEKDLAVQAEKDMRERYINRFFDKPEEGETRIIEGSEEESEIEKAEEEINYDDLFE